MLGDSFLRIYEHDEPHSGGFVAHLAYHLGFGLTSIVNDGGASTLVRQQLARRPDLLEGKKVVIWEFVERDIRFGTEGWQVIPLNSSANKLPHKNVAAGRKPSGLAAPDVSRRSAKSVTYLRTRPKSTIATVAKCTQ